MARKQIVQFDAASSIASTDRFLLQQGAAGTAFTYGTVAQLLAGGLASTFSSVTVNGSTVPANGMYLPTTNAIGWAINFVEKIRLDADGDLGVGITAPTARLHAVRDSTDSSGASITALFDGAQSVAHSGSYSVNYVKGTYTASSGTLATFNGLFSQPMVTGAGTVTTFSGVRSVPQNTSTGTVTDMYAVYARYDNSNAGGTLTNAYGVYIATSTNSGTITNRWGLYQQDPSAKNVLIGRTLIASATDDGSTAFQVNGNAKASYYLRTVGNGLTATGSSRADALQLANETNRLTTVASGTGVILPVGVVGMRVRIYQLGANPVKVYASASETIDGTAGSAGVTLTNALRCEYEFVAANTWISAQLGAVSA